jgi:DUF1365 family protein
MNSCLYECNVMHHRLAPKRHRFDYRIFMFYLDLDEIDALARPPLLGKRRFNLFAFPDTDHLGATGGTVKQKLEARLAAEGIPLPADAHIGLLTLPRVLGYIFNPVSFYFCSDAAGRPLCAIAEVENTFREKKLYFLREPAGEDRFRLIASKHFYVSPFSELDVQFDFRLRVPGATLEIHVDDLNGTETLLVSALTGARRPLTSARLAWFAIKYPFLTLRVMFLIHWHALLLWLKRVPFINKTARPDLQRDLLESRPLP